jgi:hypothetical protein
LVRLVIYAVGFWMVGKSDERWGRVGMRLTFAERVELLRPRTDYGPNFSRGVVEALADAALFFGRGQLDAAEHYLLIAEVHGGVIDEEEFYKRDPFRLAWQVRR